METRINKNAELLRAIKVAGMIVSQVLDGQYNSCDGERNYHLSRAMDALSQTYFKVTNQPLITWEHQIKARLNNGYKSEV